MKKHSTKKALLLSVFSLIICFSMLIGTTFAWFTDSVTSANNIIKSGNLDIELEYWNGEKYDKVTNTTKLFNDAALWEPGHTEVAYLKISNAGSLALMYQLNVNVVKEISGKTATGEDITLSDHLVFSVVDKEIATEDDLYTRETAIAAAGNVKGLKSYNGDAKALVNNGDADYVALIIYMPTTVGNEANHNGTDIPSIEMGVNVFATQLTSEYDSFGNDYDATASGKYSLLYTFDDPADLNAFEPSPNNDTDNTGLSLNNGKAQINNPGAWYTVDADLAANEYIIEYDVDITNLETGKNVTVNTGENVSWGSASVMLERGSTKVYSALNNNESNLVGTLTGTEVHVSHVYQYNKDGKLEITSTVSDGTESVSFTKVFASEAKTTLYWDIYFATGSGATMDNFSVKEADAVVDTADELKSALVNGGDCVLAADIDLKDVEWTPVGTADMPFSGTFDGNGHTISGLTIKSDTRGTGLFGYVSGDNTVIKDLTLENVNVSASLKETGALIGAVLDGAKVSVSGITVESGTVTSQGFAGGIIGRVNTAASITITDCVNKAAVTAICQAGCDCAGCAGGIIGYLNDAEKVVIQNNSNEGAIVSHDYAGGIVGYFSYKNTTEFDSVLLDNCTNSGNVSAYADGNSNGSDQYAGGILGRTNLANNVDLTTKEVYSSIVFSNLSNSGNVTISGDKTTGAKCAGGIAANIRLSTSVLNISGDISNSGNITSMATDSKQQGEGGLFGYLYSQSTSGSPHNGIPVTTEIIKIDFTKANLSNSGALAGVGDSHSYLGKNGSTYWSLVGFTEPTVVSTATDLATALKNGGNYILTQDIAMSGSVNLTDADFVLDGGGNTITMTEDATNTYALFDITYGKATIKNVTFDGIKGGAVIRTVTTDLTMDNVTVINSNHTQQQGLLRLLGNTTITDSTFENNNCTMVISQCYDTDDDIYTMTVENCVFKNNTCGSVAVIYYAHGAKATVNGNSFVNNKVTSTSNAATLYMGFTENNVITNNVFDGNDVTTTGATTKRATGGLMIGCTATITGNAFINNTITAEGRKLGNDVCASVRYGDIDLSGNYWGGSAPVAGDDYYQEYDNYSVIINDYLTAYNK